jgi:hypothetical protein
MALFNAFDRNKHLDELDSPLVTNEGVLTPAQRRARMLANLFASGDAVSLPGVIVNDGSFTTPKLLTATSVGTVAGGTVVAEEHGDGIDHLTKLTLTNFAVGTGDDDTDKAIGALIYTFPAGTIMVEGGSVKGIFDQASHGTITDGEIGLGTVVAAGAVSVLSGTATFNNILLGSQGTAIMTNYVLGTTVAEVAGVGPSGQPLAILAAGVHTVYLNLGADWPNIAAAEAVTFNGVVTIRWRLVS